ncbi:hypothetical protein NDU88_000302 [Pleurodeles waltl]|uniref:Uncharacterized protein n=1 Tax=Pleurodeles waltl TaxID=8319 RepID=A0AAV7KLV3_PLEWA|nr:hypothetical protein NDU88_000302 [Pleurodeles waltl]
MTAALFTWQYRIPLPPVSPRCRQRLTQALDWPAGCHMTEIGVACNYRRASDLSKEAHVTQSRLDCGFKKRAEGAEHFHVCPGELGCTSFLKPVCLAPRFPAAFVRAVQIPEAQLGVELPTYLLRTYKTQAAILRGTLLPQEASWRKSLVARPGLTSQLHINVK